jgi:U3 small nucleolar RNA-associated protein 3
MAKRKRKTSSQNGPSTANERHSSKLAVNSWEDVADSEDEYLLKREKILLDEGPDAKRRRKVAEDGLLLRPERERRTKC